MEIKESSLASTKVLALFKQEKKPLTLAEINQHHPELKANQISMALSYLMKSRYLSREQKPNQNAKGRKNVFVYTHHEVRLPKPEAEVVNAN